MDRNLLERSPSDLDRLVEPVLRGLGYELVELERRGRNLCVYMEKPGGVTVEDCAQVSEQLQRVFEVEGVDYRRLEVSSPGLDRRLRGAADFARFAGRRIDVRMRRADAAGRRRYVGRLTGLEGEVAQLEVDGERVGLPLAEMEVARLVPEWPAPGTGRTKR